MIGRDDPYWRERVALRYINALDAGDLDTVDELWEAAKVEPELATLLFELNEGLEDEAEAELDFDADAATVVELARVHMPSARPDDEPAGPLLALDVARRLEAEPEFRRLEPADRVAHARLLAEAAAIPEALGQPAVDAWLRGLGVEAGPSYRRAFRKVAVLLDMGRRQREGRLAAARRAGPQADEKEKGGAS